MNKRTLSTKAKVITGLIYLLAAIMLATVIYLNLHPGTKVSDLAGGKETTTAVETTVEAPYNAEGSDKYANIEPAYKIPDVTLQQEGSDLVAYVEGKKAENYIGVATDGTNWYLVRDGVVDKNYNGIAGNELGNWYLKNGMVDFTYDGEFTVNNTTYNIEKGKVVEE